MSTPRWKARCAALFALLATIAATFAIVGPSRALAAGLLSPPTPSAQNAAQLEQTGANLGAVYTDFTEREPLRPPQRRF